MLDSFALLIDARSAFSDGMYNGVTALQCCLLKSSNLACQIAILLLTRRGHPCIQDTATSLIRDGGFPLQPPHLFEGKPTLVAWGPHRTDLTRFIPALESFHAHSQFE